MQRSSCQTEKLVRRRIRVLLTVSSTELTVLVCVTIDYVAGGINVENPIEFSKHQAEDTSRYTKRGTENDAYVSHGHFVDC